MKDCPFIDLKSLILKNWRKPNFCTARLAAACGTLGGDGTQFIIVIQVIMHVIKNHSDGARKRENNPSDIVS